MIKLREISQTEKELREISQTEKDKCHMIALQVESKN